MGGKIDDEERRQWVNGDEGLYWLQQASGLRMWEFVRKNRVLIDEVINNVLSRKKQPHYLVYDVAEFYLKHVKIKIGGSDNESK